MQARKAPESLRWRLYASSGGVNFDPVDRTGLGFIREKERPHKTGKARGFPFQMKQVSLSHTQALFFNFELGEREKENDHRKREKSLASLRRSSEK